MSDHGTLSNEIPGWYIQFQADALLQLPRPGEISEEIALGWHDNRGEMKKILRTALSPFTKTVRAQLLIPVGLADVAAITVPFVARDHFVLNTKKNAPVKISYLGDNFKDWFLGKEDPLFAGSILKYEKLSRSSLDSTIVAELGGGDQAEVTLTEIFSLMKAQKNGEDGPLLTNGYANIFYVRESTGVLRTVFVYWYGYGWHVRAFVVTDPRGWDVEGRVFSRNSP